MLKRTFVWKSFARKDFPVLGILNLQHRGSQPISVGGTHWATKNRETPKNLNKKTFTTHKNFNLTLKNLQKICVSVYLSKKSMNRIFFSAHRLRNTGSADQSVWVSVNKFFGKSFKFLIVQNERERNNNPVNDEERSGRSVRLVSGFWGHGNISDCHDDGKNSVDADEPGNFNNLIFSRLWLKLVFNNNNNSSWHQSLSTRFRDDVTSVLEAIL